jgi:hypothetical protein
MAEHISNELHQFITLRLHNTGAQYKGKKKKAQRATQKEVN